MKETFTRQEVIDLLIEERKRGVRIAYAFYKDNQEKFESQKKIGWELAFVTEKVANECRLVGNAISGLTALSAPLGETLETRFIEEFNKNAE